MDYNVGIIITARINSERLHQKVLQIINNKYAIDILLDHVINDQYPVVLAIPDDSDNDILNDIGTQRGIEVFRGCNDSPFHRLYAAAEQFGFDYVVRVTADNILVDLRILLNQIRWTINGGHEYVYMSRCPSGIAGEVIKTSALKKIISDDKYKNKNIEFACYEVKNKIRTAEYYPPFEYQYRARLTMDYEEDLTLLRILYACMVNPGTLDIINFIKKNKWCLDINHMPEVTIYTCNYNTAPYVFDCIQSVMNQTFTDWEYLIIDDHSNDDSMNVISEYISLMPLQIQKKIKVLRNDENIGLPSCSNKALTRARGNFIVRVDSDDRLHSEYLARTIEAIKLNECHAALSGYCRTNEKLETLNEILVNEWNPACALISRSAANEIKYRDSVKFCEGDIFFADFRKYYKHTFITATLWDYRERPGQKTKDPQHPKNLECANYG